jgi:hypothetical protein
MHTILYIDNRKYRHNAELHINSISSLSNNFKIIGYGNHLSEHFSTTYKVPLKNNYKKFGIHENINISASNSILDTILAKHKPDAILTYNSNGSSYDVGLDNVHLYSWISEKLSTLSIPKFHVTTDYCRDGYRREQGKWFEYVGYDCIFFRGKESLKYPPISIPKYWLPFSVNKNVYANNSIFNLTNKANKVGFIGAAHNSDNQLYHQRIAAIDYLNSKNILEKVLPQATGKVPVLLGDEYVNFITSNLFGLTCGGSCNYMTAKYFQIPAAYSMLICSNTNGIEEFPKDTYILYDIKNLDYLYDQILYHINNPKITEEKIYELNKYILTNYSQESVNLYFENIIKNFIK